VNRCSPWRPDEPRAAKRCSIVALAVVAIVAAIAIAPARGQSALPLETLKLPPGFSIEIVARIPNARAMTWGAAGTLFVGSAHAGTVYALTLPPPGAKGEAVSQVIATGLREPAGVAFWDGALYVSAVSRILRFDDIEKKLSNPPAPVVVSERFPSESRHGRKFIAFGPDGKLYVPVGVPCNVCELDPDRYGVFMRMNPDGSGLEVFARGLRNSVGFDWDPRTRELWFTDNGRDQLGDDVPPDTLNHAPRAGLRFGFPYCHAGVPDPEFGKKAGLQRVPGAGGESGAARRVARNALLHRDPVSPGVPEPDLHCRARLVEPQPADRLSRHDGDPRRRQDVALRAVRRRMAAG
jgi:glucose/arabinose dehydrogenase